MNETSKAWHAEVIASRVLETARQLAEIKVVRDFYLAGGTALALHFGHRRSIDLDFFSSRKFNEDGLIADLQKLPEFSVVSRSNRTVYLQISGTKLSFIGYDYPMLFPLVWWQELAVADVRDIACMKLAALASRGSRRDFVDIYVAAQQYALAHLLELFGRKYAQARYSMLHIRKALTYFADAEAEAMPDMLVPLSWEELKAFFLREVPRLHAG